MAQANYVPNVIRAPITGAQTKLSTALNASGSCDVFPHLSVDLIGVLQHSATQVARRVA